MSNLVVKTSAGEVVADLSFVVACRGFSDDDACWRGPVGLWMAEKLVGVVVFNESEADFGEWPDLSEADLEAVEVAVVDELGRWGTAVAREVRVHLSCDEYRARVAIRLAA